MTNTRRSSVRSGLLSGQIRHPSDSPQPLGAVNERNDENVFISDLVDEAIRFHEELSDRLVTKFRYRLPTLCEFSKGPGSFKGFLNKGRRAILRVSRNVGRGSLKIVPSDRSRLLLDPSGHPLHDLLVRDDVALLNCLKATLDLLTNVDVVLNVVQRNIVWKFFQ